MVVVGTFSNKYMYEYKLFLILSIFIRFDEILLLYSQNN